MTTTQVRPASTRVIATAGVTISSPALTDSANGFTAADIGKLVTSANVPGATTILSVTPGTATMSANASATSGPQSATIGAVFAAVTLTGTNQIAKASLAGLGLREGPANQALRALGEWHNAAGTGGAAADAQTTAAAVGLALQEV